MTKVKSNRIFLGIVTCAMALAGTGLTIANNFELDLQIAAIAITLAACFTAAECTFLWGHKRFESSTRLWRKIVLAVSLVLLVGAMGFAVYEELHIALAKIANRSLASNSAIVVKNADVKNQRSLGRTVIQKLSEGKVQADPLPFVICYLITGLVSIAILAVTEKAKERTIKGNALPANKPLQSAVKHKIGYDSPTIKAYAVNGGYSIYEGKSYKGFIPERAIEKGEEKL